MSDRTEAPTQRRLEEARAEGQVPRSLELNTAAALLGGALLLFGPGGGMITAMQDMLSSTIVALPQVTFSDTWIRDWAVEQALRIAPSLGLLMVGMLAIGVVVTLAQTRFMWTSKNIGFDVKRINPLDGFKRMFSKQGLVELARSLLKLGLVGWVAYSFLRNETTTLLTLGQMDLAAGVARWITLAKDLCMRVGASYFILAVIDYAYQRWRFTQGLKMTKEEIKEEYKRSEGDPFLKSRIRGQQRRMARNRMMANVPKASVVITNPTHLAVAIEYTPGKMDAPRLVAKGAFNIAHKIVDVAKANGIPVVQNIPLARAIYKTVELDGEIPPELYLAMAEVLAYVYKLRGQRTTAAPA